MSARAALGVEIPGRVALDGEERHVLGVEARAAGHRRIQLIEALLVERDGERADEDVFGEEEAGPGFAHTLSGYGEDRRHAQILEGPKSEPLAPTHREGRPPHLGDDRAPSQDEQFSCRPHVGHRAEGTHRRIREVDPVDDHPVVFEELLVLRALILHLGDVEGVERQLPLVEEVGVVLEHRVHLVGRDGGERHFTQLPDPVAAHLAPVHLRVDVEVVEVVPHGRIGSLAMAIAGDVFELEFLVVQALLELLDPSLVGRGHASLLLLGDVDLALAGRYQERNSPSDWFQLTALSRSSWSASRSTSPPLSEPLSCSGLLAPTTTDTTCG